MSLLPFGDWLGSCCCPGCCSFVVVVAAAGRVTVWSRAEGACVAAATVRRSKSLSLRDAVG